MHFGPNECTHCGYIRGPYTSAEYDIPADGVFYRLEQYECAFCSDKCLEAALRPYMNDRFALDKDFEDDPAIRQIIENLKTVQKLIDAATLKSNEERAELEEYRIYHADALQEAARAWDQGQQDAIDAALTSYIVQWARESNAHLARVLEKDLKEKKREYERERREEDAARKRELLDLQRKRREVERELSVAQREYQQKLRDEERSLEKEKREQEAKRRELDRAYERAEAEHRDVLKQEAYEEAIKPKPVPEHARFEHTIIVAGAGHGKTQLLEYLIANDLKKDDPPALIVLDSTGALVERIQRLKIFSDKLRDRILILDPAHSPALNMFDLSADRFEALSEEQREDVQTDIIALFNYIFASSDYDLSSQMGLAFSYAVRLMLTRNRSTLIDLRTLLEEMPKSYEGSAYKDDIERLDPDSFAFFKLHFYSESLRATRLSIARRIHSLTAVPSFRRMFTTSTNALDFFTEMNHGTIVLVNTNINLLKEDGMVLFGRYIIARALAAAFERATMPLEQRRPAYLIVDEAAPYFDDAFEKLLTRVRQFRLGLVVAFQHLEQADDKLKAAIGSSTRIKYAAALGYKDRLHMARDMETTPEFIAAQKKDTRNPPQFANFALYVRPDFETACSVPVPFYSLKNNFTEMSDADHRRLIERNNARVAPKTHEAPEPEASRAHAPSQPNTTSFGISPEPKRKAAPNESPQRANGANDHDVLINPHVGDHTEPATKWGDKE